MRDTGIKFSGKQVEFDKPINVYMLEKINGAIEEMKLGVTDEPQIAFTFAELQTLRRLLVIDDINTQLSYHNVKEGVEYRKSTRDNCLSTGVE